MPARVSRSVYQELFVRNRGWLSPVTVLGIDHAALDPRLSGWRVRLLGDRPVLPGAIDPFRPLRIEPRRIATVTLMATLPGCRRPTVGSSIVLRSVPLRFRVRGSIQTAQVALQPPVPLICADA